MEPTPDLEGYVGAQERLRAQFGQEVPFFTPTTTVWPSGVPVDASGVPIDPSVAPLASGFASAAVTCSVTNRPVRATRLTPPTEDEAIGIMSHSMLLLVMSKKEFDTNAIEDATECEVYEKRYKIESASPDQIGPGEVQRMQIFVERM
jgi:hypothetical protein